MQAVLCRRGRLSLATCGGVVVTFEFRVRMRRNITLVTALFEDRKQSSFDYLWE